jgi:hypothetical protein
MHWHNNTTPSIYSIPPYTSFSPISWYHSLHPHPHFHTTSSHTSHPLQPSFLDKIPMKQKDGIGAKLVVVQALRKVRRTHFLSFYVLVVPTYMNASNHPLQSNLILKQTIYQKNSIYTSFGRSLPSLLVSFTDEFRYYASFTSSHTIVLSVMLNTRPVLLFQ